MTDAPEEPIDPSADHTLAITPSDSPDATVADSDTQVDTVAASGTQVDTATDPADSSTDPADSSTDPADSAEANFVIMSVGSVHFELPSPSPIISLIEQEYPYRELSIPVGLPEAQSLAQALHQIEGVRPSTHELFSLALMHLQAEIIAVRLTAVRNGVYYAELDLMTPRGRIVMDCRPTDAVILSVRQGVPAPILCDAQVLGPPIAS